MRNKVVRDLLHSYIEIDEKIQVIVDTPNFQRLRRIKQLSCNLLFPSTNHTRYEHSLGVMNLALKFFKRLESDFKSFNLDDKKINFLKIHLQLASLLHDVGHPAFSHLGEKFLVKREILARILDKYGDRIGLNTFIKNDKIIGSEHELMSCYVILEKYQKLLKELFGEIDFDFICKMIVGSKYEEEDNWDRNICISILNSGSVDVDKLDYLMRDNHMIGEIAPKMDIMRLIASLKIASDKKLKFTAKGLPAIQSVVDCRDSLYLWVYHHHISIYTEYIIGKILLGCYANHLASTQSDFSLDIKDLYSCDAIANNLIGDDDVYSFLRKIYILSQKKSKDDFLSNALAHIFERKFLKTLWKTIYEYKDFYNMLLEEKVIKDSQSFNEILKNEEVIEDIRQKILKKLGLRDYELYIITKYNRFYYSVNDAPIDVYLNGQDRKLRDLLPQKSYTDFQERSFFIFTLENMKKEVRDELINQLKQLNI